MYAQVIINFAKTQEIDRLFTYSVPYALLPKVQIGSRVKVPFGQGNHTQIGYVIHLSSNPPEEHYRIKPIVSLFDEIPVFNEEQIEIAKFLVNYYGCSFAMALEVMLPPGMSKKPYSSFEEAETYITLNIKPEVLKSYIASKAHMKSFNKQRAILMLFLIQASISLEDLKKSNEVSPSSLSTLIKNGILRKEEKFIGFRKDPIHYDYFKKLNLEQTYAKDQLLAAIGANRYEGVLLQGITGSGKTEVFLYAICKVLEEGGSAIVLVPEIALTRQTLMRFKERFGNVVALTHSRMNQTERLRLYEQVRKGQIKVVIGPRSAVFMPMQNLKLIVVDEEHETTYKSETTPKYHAIDVARMRMIRNSGVLILASATPSLESYYEMKRDRLKLIELTQRVGNATLPEIEIVDMRKELKNGNMQIMSHTLHEAIERTVRAGNQVMLLLNRRGHSTFVNCRSCAFVVKCKHCDIAMTS